MGHVLQDTTRDSILHNGILQTDLNVVIENIVTS